MSIFSNIFKAFSGQSEHEQLVQRADELLPRWTVMKANRPAAHSCDGCDVVAYENEPTWYRSGWEASGAEVFIGESGVIDPADCDHWEIRRQA